MHHAYFYEGSLSLLPELAEAACRELGFKREGNPDVHVEGWEKFGIDESRALIEAAALRSTSGRALWVVGIGSITTQAQQALLKLLEEPQEGLVFILLVPHGTLLPTVRSRMMRYPSQLVISKKSSGRPSDLNQTFSQQRAAAFLQSAGKARSEEIGKLLKDEEGAKERAREFVNALEQALYVRPTRSHKEILRGLEEIQVVRGYLGDRSASLKMLLEHLAVALPQL